MQNKIKPIDFYLPQGIVGIIASFVGCKKCSKILHLMSNEPKNLTTLQLKIWYFTSLNPFPSMKMINEQYAVGHYGHFEKLFALYEENPVYFPRKVNKYEYHKKAFKNIHNCEKLTPYTHRDRLMGYIRFMLTDTYKNEIICPKSFKEDTRFIHYFQVYVNKLKYDFK